MQCNCLQHSLNYNVEVTTLGLSQCDLVNLACMLIINPLEKSLLLNNKSYSNYRYYHFFAEVLQLSVLSALLQGQMRLIL